YLVQNQFILRGFLSIGDGNGESLYPISSFPINRKGDTALFTQKVKGSGKIMGRRTVAGQVVKQQHTFTVSILIIIKSSLCDFADDRVKVLSEKHSRGATAARKVMRERKIKLGYIYGRLQKPDHVKKAGLSIEKYESPFPLPQFPYICSSTTRTVLHHVLLVHTLLLVHIFLVQTFLIYNKTNQSKDHQQLSSTEDLLLMLC
ncbi:unnamed protein product, partial [Brassica oleracea]